ncbi:NAD(P)-dependent alcohol dehydrogenase [Lactiplantibacillus pentosus]|uniref:NAD(P)-dependent alcohol dehydrogenase n=1 Tax=Lactiplantibacillus pentosus TaxID=1589 RepID=UPI000B547A1D|nr:NAD(P)-dependent alcohol dehydrogenase [Lactiplantibacillus pentosus]ASG80267.1 alcohol dehydrogenase [Lactiplantibacillus pentosus]MDO7805628.1 NAD(P)-dependent alcohol dehydrogenase [Lactiplantibacillus pentosus]
MTQPVKALQARTKGDFSAFEQTIIQRRDLRQDDVAIEIKYCGICHSDVSMVQWQGAHFPMVPGHEISGIVTAVGSDVKDFKPGDCVGVGCFVNSCGKCAACRAGREQFCEKGTVIVFDSEDDDGTITQGGYSQAIVVKDHFVLHIPDELSLADAAPLLCAGITTYNPMKQYQIGAGSKVAVIGLGGLGHIAVQFAAKMGADVTVLGHSESKREEAQQFGATSYEILRDPADFAPLAGQYDFILNTVAVDLNIGDYLPLLKFNGTLCYVGIPSDEIHFNLFSMFGNQANITASNVGGIALTQEMLDFAAKNHIKPQIEMIGIDDVADAYQNILDSKVHYRYVIDMATLK